ncbi:MAG: hypothetical protein Q4F49_06125 [Pseudoxanthomonas suwonensis]|nr:hypothetical protein [Pseudoxanthomonas suwonensis]
MSLRVSCIAVLLALACTATAAAHRPAPGPVTLQLLDRDGGGLLPTVAHRGQQWTAGTPGQRYAVRLTNHSPGRVLVVLSVDGVNAITGETASPAQTGYVLGPGQSSDITGWRKSQRDVAAFHFTDLGDSYAARTGRPDDVGVIGIAVFHERRPRPLPRPLPPPIARSAGASAASARNATAEQAAPQSVGTGHGAREHAPVGTTSFIRATSQPAMVTTLRYDSRRNLLARGIRLPTRASAWSAPRKPRAFPGGFVPDPE